MKKENIICTVAEVEEILNFDLLELLTSRGLKFTSTEKIEIEFHDDYIIIMDNKDGETII